MGEKKKKTQVKRKKKKIAIATEPVRARSPRNGLFVTIRPVLVHEDGS